MKTGFPSVLLAAFYLAVPFAADVVARAESAPIDLMTNEIAYRVEDFSGNGGRKPVMGCELSDFGSWYDVAYSGGVNRFYLNSTRYHTYNQVGFNTAQDVALFALFFRTPEGDVIDGEGLANVTWFPYGWKTTTRAHGLEIESTAFYSAFNTIAVVTRVTNAGKAAATLVPSLAVTDRSEYDGMHGGLVEGWMTADGRLLWKNRRIGVSSDPTNYRDSVVVGSTLGALSAGFLPDYLSTARGAELKSALGKTQGASLASAFGAALVSAPQLDLRSGESAEFAFFITAGADDAAALAASDDVREDFVKHGATGVMARVRADWNDYLARLPKLRNPSPDELKLYYSAASGLRTNRLLLKRLPAEDFTSEFSDSGLHAAANFGARDGEAVYYKASCPSRGGFNLFIQSDACWNLLGYLDADPEWAAGHAVPILVPPSIIMDPHFFWSMWELYDRTPDPAERRALAAEIYPLLENAYRLWTEKIDIDGNLLCSTPNNWDDDPRADLLFAESKDDGSWNSWWSDWVKKSRDNFLEMPSASAQLAHGTVVMARFADILGKTQDAAMWRMQYEKHVAALDTLWDERLGYWIVTYKHSGRDTVLTSSIVYPIFTDTCRDPAKIRRVIETHLLNPAEFNGKFPAPTVAYNDPRYYKQKPPRANEPGGLWRGNIWLPDAWIVVKGLYKYGYEDEARNMADRLVGMMAHQAEWVKDAPQFAHAPCEYYDSRTGAGQNIRRLNWSCALAMEFLLGNYENERVIGANPARDTAVRGHVREIYLFSTRESVFRVESANRVYPVLSMKSLDGKPIGASASVEFSFDDPAGNMGGKPVRFSFDAKRWVLERDGKPVKAASDGLFEVLPGVKQRLVAMR
jgi:hypothetical protein